MNGLKNGAAECRLQWKVGLVNFQTRYLTAETFGCKINASGTTMRKKQLWIIEHDPTEDDTVYIRSHLGRYLAGDKRGNVTCSSEEIGEAERFSIQYHTDGSGRWAVRNRVTGYYFGGAEDSLKCYEKQPGQSEWWTVHLAIHPQVNLRNLNRQKYAFLDPTTDRLQVTALIPWGQAALVTLEFRDGRYCVRSSDGRYLHRDGSLVSDPSPDTSFSLEIKSGQFSGLALKDCTGKYLTAVGREAVMQARNKSIGKDELFTIEDSHPQVIFKAHNGKMVSIRQGMSLYTYVCMYVCLNICLMFIFVYVCIRVYLYVRMYLLMVSIRQCMPLYTSVCRHVCLNVCVCLYLGMLHSCVSLCMYCMCDLYVCMYVCMYVGLLTYIQLYIHVNCVNHIFSCSNGLSKHIIPCFYFLHQTTVSAAGSNLQSLNPTMLRNRHRCHTGIGVDSGGQPRHAPPNN